MVEVRILANLGCRHDEFLMATLERKVTLPAVPKKGDVVYVDAQELHVINVLFDITTTLPGPIECDVETERIEFTSPKHYREIFSVLEANGFTRRD